MYWEYSSKWNNTLLSVWIGITDRKTTYYITFIKFISEVTAQQQQQHQQVVLAVLVAKDRGERAGASRAAAQGHNLRGRKMNILKKYFLRSINFKLLSQKKK
jgi:hypothetical protein